MRTPISTVRDGGGGKQIAMHSSVEWSTTTRMARPCAEVVQAVVSVKKAKIVQAIGSRLSGFFDCCSVVRCSPFAACTNRGRLHAATSMVAVVVVGRHRHGVMESWSHGVMGPGGGQCGSSRGYGR